MAFVMAGCLIGCTVQQIMPGVVYRIVTPEAAACPALTWVFVVDAQRNVDGTVARAGQTPFGAVSGTVGADDSVRMTLADGATHQTATVTGQFTSGISTITIRGDGAGTGCDGQSFNLRLGGYFSRQGGGGGGGG